MTETTQTLTTLSRTEATLLSAFIYQIDAWLSQYGEKANTVEIVYYPEDDGFEVANGETANGILKRNRTTVFRADILTWANTQLKQLKGWNNDKEVKAFTCVYKNNEFGVSVEVGEKQATAESPVTD